MTVGCGIRLPGSPVPVGESPNIIQKGLTTDTGGQWKMSLKQDMVPLCVFKGDTNADPDITTIQQSSITPETGQSDLDPGDRYRIRCELQQGVVSIDVDRVNSNNDLVFHSEGSDDEDNHGPYMRISNNAKVWVGKKPAPDDTPGDTYAGAIDNVSIQRFTQ